MKLNKQTIEVKKLLLDPNNPRFADISDENLNILSNRFADDEVQKNAYNKMMNPKFDVISLANSIETVGFLPVDNIVAREIENGNCVVIEGNRRTTALKYIINQYNLGQSSLSEEQIRQISSIEILIVDNIENETENIGKIIQGIRNVSGIKEWDAYQKAQFVTEMIEKGKSPGVISKMIGMTVKDVNRYYKTYCAMSQFRNDEEYGGKWKHSYFSHFDEILKRPALRDYLGWDEDHYTFLNQPEYRRFYDWITTDDEREPAISDAHDVRVLVNLIDDPKALNYLDDKNLKGAINYYEQKNLNASKITLPECLGKINHAIEAFKNIIAEGLEKNMTKEDIEDLMTSIIDMENQLKRIKTLKDNES